MHQPTEVMTFKNVRVLSFLPLKKIKKPINTIFAEDADGASLKHIWRSTLPLSCSSYEPGQQPMVFPCTVAESKPGTGSAGYVHQFPTAPCAQSCLSPCGCASTQVCSLYMHWPSNLPFLGRPIMVFHSSSLA